MMQPGRETNYPTSSGSVQPGVASTALVTLNGFTVTLGMVALVVLLYLFYRMARKRR